MGLNYKVLFLLLIIVSLHGPLGFGINIGGGGGGGGKSGGGGGGGSKLYNLISLYKININCNNFQKAS